MRPPQRYPSSLLAQRCSPGHQSYLRWMCDETQPFSSKDLVRQDSADQPNLRESMVGDGMTTVRFPGPVARASRRKCS
uniref:Uncharacterized protein n=1 Tax=Rhodococcus sp. NS1 TaxID=402236 RepID=A0A097SQB2_9NOCA|nr:hypothetical protein LRS1606.273 [Rhodococcus sp. NS1]